VAIECLVPEVAILFEFDLAFELEFMRKLEMCFEGSWLTFRRGASRLVVVMGWMDLLLFIKLSYDALVRLSWPYP